MLDLDFARDLVMTGVIFGAAAFVWAGWGQERPPEGVTWRVVLVVLQAAGLVLVSFVGIHFLPLAFVFGQPIMVLAAVLFTAAGIAALLLPWKVAAPSFWCGILAGPIFLGPGAIAFVPALAALGGKLSPRAPGGSPSPTR